LGEKARFDEDIVSAFSEIDMDRWHAGSMKDDWRMSRRSPDVMTCGFLEFPPSLGHVSTATPPISHVTGAEFRSSIREQAAWQGPWLGCRGFLV
jgi:hypothetical protein